jgi:hypothetical protein
MGETKVYPKIDTLLAECDKYPDWLFTMQKAPHLRAIDAKNADLATELRALLAERDALAAKWEDAERRLDDEKALRFEAQRPAARRLREVFGVRYTPKDPLPWVLHDTHRFRTLSGLIDSAEGSAAGLSDNSHKFLLSLESEPYEKAEDRLRDVIVKTVDYIGSSNIFKLVDAIRAEFPHIDEPQEPDLEQTLCTWLAQQPAPTLTAAQHVEALVGMGAVRYDKVEAFTHHNGKTYQTMPLHRPSILVLPADSEATP